MRHVLFAVPAEPWLTRAKGVYVGTPFRVDGTLARVLRAELDLDVEAWVSKADGVSAVTVTLDRSDDEGKTWWSPERLQYRIGAALPRDRSGQALPHYFEIPLYACTLPCHHDGTNVCEVDGRVRIVEVPLRCLYRVTLHLPIDLRIGLHILDALGVVQ